LSWLRADLVLRAIASETQMNARAAARRIDGRSFHISDMADFRDHPGESSVASCRLVRCRPGSTSLKP